MTDHPRQTSQIESGAARADRSVKRRLPGRVAVAVLLISPFLAIAWIFYAVNGSIEAGTELAAPARGAGAGDTGGANAIGEMLAGNESGRPEREADEDEPEID